MDSAQSATNQSDIFEPLFQQIYTKSDLQRFYSELDQTRGLLFKTSGDFDQHLGTFFNPEKKDKLLALLDAKKIDTKNPVAVQDVFTKIEEYGNKFPIVTMTFAMPPTELILKHINNWFLENEKRKVLIDVSYERNLLGGAFISYNGLYADGTLIYKVNEYFHSNSA